MFGDTFGRFLGLCWEGCCKLFRAFLEITKDQRKMYKNPTESINTYNNQAEA